jgi:hypothetical protein
LINIQQLMAQMQKQLPAGMAPPQQPLPGGPPPGVPTMGNHMMPGPYGAQANQLAGGGLLGGPYQQQAQQLSGLLGAPGQMPQLPVGRAPYAPGRFMPGFRPGIDQPIQGHAPQPRRPIQQY